MRDSATDRLSKLSAGVALAAPGTETLAELVDLVIPLDALIGERLEIERDLGRLRPAAALWLRDRDEEL